MRFCPGWLCHGRPRRPLEPVGRLAPLLRTVGWAITGVGAVPLVLVPPAYFAYGARPASGLVAGGITVTFTGGLIRFVAACARLEPLVLPLKAGVRP